MKKDQNNRRGQHCVEKKTLKIETGRREDMRQPEKPPETDIQGITDGNAEFHTWKPENRKVAKDQHNRRGQQFVEEETTKIETGRRKDMRRTPKLELERRTSRELAEPREIAQEDGQHQSIRAEERRDDEAVVGRIEVAEVETVEAQALENEKPKGHLFENQGEAEGKTTLGPQPQCKCRQHTIGAAARTAILRLYFQEWEHCWYYSAKPLKCKTISPKANSPLAKQRSDRRHNACFEQMPLGHAARAAFRDQIHKTHTRGLHRG